MPQSLAAHCAARLEGIRARDLFRHRRPASGFDGRCARQGEGSLRVFCSNDYLGLATHPQVVASWREAAKQYGVGSSASAYVCGYRDQQAMLESELAAWLGRERCLLFGAGYLANPGVIDALVGRGDEIWSDALNHASLIDGCRLSGATVHRIPHADMGALEDGLAGAGAGNRLVVSDAVFSMDGDCADLRALARIAADHQAWLMVDDAHGLGVTGPAGAGSVAAAGLSSADVPVLTATLGKSLGVYGAFIAGDEELVEMLVQTARSAIFTTALPPALVAAVRTALRLARDEHWRREHLMRLIRRFRAGLNAAGLPDTGSETPIQPLIVGDAAAAVALSAALSERGFWVGAIRPPTVPEGTSRLRVTLSAAHTDDDVDALLEVLADCWPRH